MTEIKDDHNKLVDERRKKLLSLREEGFNYPISIEIDTTIKNLFEAYGESSREEVSDANKTVKIAGRMMAKRIMGKSSFSKVVDSSGSIQLFLNFQRFVFYFLCRCEHVSRHSMGRIRFLGWFADGTRDFYLRNELFHCS